MVGFGVLYDKKRRELHRSFSFVARLVIMEVEGNHFQGLEDSVRVQEKTDSEDRRWVEFLKLVYSGGLLISAAFNRMFSF